MNTLRNRVWLGVWVLGLGFLIVSVLLMMPSSTAAQAEQGFGDQNLNGSYGFKVEGDSYLILPSEAEEPERVGPSPFNILGQIVADGKGQITQGVRTANFDGLVLQDTVTGTYAVNSDGTGTLELTVFIEDEPVAVETFDCFFTWPGNQFECTATSVELLGEDEPEVSWVALATGLHQSNVSADTGWEDQIREASAAWDEAFNAENLEQLMELYAEEAVSMPPGFVELKGKEAIRGDFEFIFGEYDWEHKTYIVDMQRSESLVVEQGQYTMKDGDTVIECGKHIVIRKRLGDTWKVVKEIWNAEFGTEFGNDPAGLGCPVPEPEP